MEPDEELPDIASIMRRGREATQDVVDENSRAPAIPVECDYVHIQGSSICRGRRTGNTSGWEIGLTKREYFSGLAMQALIIRNLDVGEVNVAHWAVEQADKLLIELTQAVAQPIEPCQLEGLVD